MRNEITRWKKEFGLEAYALNVYYLSQKQMNKKFSHNVVGHATPEPEYLFGRLYFSSWLKNDKFGRETVFHELRHFYYESLLTRLRQLESLMANSKQEAFNRVLNSLVEEMIERDINFYQKRGRI